MRAAALVIATLLLAVGTAPTTSAQDTPALAITELLPAPDAAAGQREFIEVHNPGANPIDLAGWVLRDAPTASNNTNSFTFPAFILDGGRRVVVWSNGTPDGTGFTWSASPSKAVWNDAGDAATLLDPHGTVRSWVGYGSTSQTPPAGFPPSKPAAPGRGLSLQWSDGAWQAAAPTPGLAPGEAGGAVAATVANVAPTVRLEAASPVRPGEAVAVRVRVDDDNGGADIVSWTLDAAETRSDAGNGSIDATRVVTAPAAPGNWTLRLEARDAAGANASTRLVVAVQRAVVSVQMPPEGPVRFLALQPGQRNATSLQPFTLRNEGSVRTTPLLDISPLRSGEAAIPVDGNLLLGLDGGTGIAWTRYAGPLQALGELAPGQSVAVWLRIAEVPVPAAAGVYGTAFTVVAA